MGWWGSDEVDFDNFMVADFHEMSQLPFIPNHVYNRRKDIHERYGGNPQSGISPSASFPYIFIFSGTSGHQHGYKDGWDNEFVFSYTGEGQVGDMRFTRGNQALKMHKENGNRVFLFETNGRGSAKFISEVELITFNFQSLLDREGNSRIGITFFFKRVGIYLPIEIKDIFQPQLTLDPNYLPQSHIPNATERKGLITSRVGQGAYRDRVILRWKSKCAVTGFDKPKLLIASHIQPWKDSMDSERVDPFNGILLSPTYDALFDRHLITFEDTGQIVLSEKIEFNAYKKIGVTGKETISDFRLENHFYLDKHRHQFGEANR